MKEVLLCGDGGGREGKGKNKSVPKRVQTGGLRRRLGDQVDLIASGRIQRTIQSTTARRLSGRSVVVAVCTSIRFILLLFTDPGQAR